MALNDQFTPILVSRRLFVMNFFKPWQSTKSQGSPDGSTRDRKIGTLGLKRKMGQKWNEPFDLIDKSESDSIPNGKIVQFAIRSITSPTILSRLNKTYDFSRINMIDLIYNAATGRAIPDIHGIVPILDIRNLIRGFPRNFCSGSSFFGSDISHTIRWQWRIIEIQIRRIQYDWIGRSNGFNGSNGRMGRFGQGLGRVYFVWFQCPNSHVCFVKFNSKK